MKKILIIEDNPDILENTSEILELSNYQVYTAPNGKEGVAKALANKPDLIVCDIMMPELDGYGVLHMLQKNPDLQDTPFIFLTAKTEKDEIRKGMSLGADDYITKPFQANELVARVKSRLRRSTEKEPARILKVGNLEMQLDRYTVTLEGKPIHLTSKEFSLLRALIMTNGRVLSRDALFESVWGHHKDADLQSRTIDVHIRSLRNKLGPEGRRIFTVRNVGYRLDPSSSSPQSSSPQSAQ